MHKIIEGPKGNIEHMLANMPVKKKKVVCTVIIVLVSDFFLSKYMTNI